MEAETPVGPVHKEAVPRGPAAELISLGFPGGILTALTPAIVAARLMHYAAGDTVYREGAEVDALYVIRSGRIKLLNYLGSGRVRIIRMHNRGSIVGLCGLVHEPHSHTAVAIDDVTAHQIPLHVMKTITDQNAETSRQLIKFLHEYLHLADTWITDFSTGAIRGRVARLLCYMVETEENAEPCEVTLLTVDEMADILGVTPESVSRTMADLKRKKILQSTGGVSHNRYLCNMKRLLREAEQ